MSIVFALFLTVFLVFGLFEEFTDLQEMIFTNSLICIYTLWHGDRFWETVNLSRIEIKEGIKHSSHRVYKYYYVVIAFNTGEKIQISAAQANAFGYSLEQFVRMLHEMYPHTKPPQPLPLSKKERADALLAKGEKLRREMKTREAIAAYERAITLFPDYAAHKITVADLYFELGEHDKAVDAYRHGLAFSADNAEAWKRLGTCYLHTRRYEEATNAFAQTLRLMPDNADALYQGAMAYSRLYDTEQARLYVQKALVINPTLRERVLQNPLLNGLESGG
ncbi:MAG: tetratricopeptide repeat protein [Ardenticatenaceae bacterium]|nr:tetratricopeptide repeat protein [Ardenticatenaceae bacterium]MCB8990668.1 tetratricopeptide repeat protein [Ardenticatenaceae bacterium]